MNSRDRMTRAEDYVFGLMNEQERARAERDMQVDPEFREYVSVLAERLRRLHRAKEASSVADTDWNEITQRLTQMPQMSGNDLTARMAEMGLQAPDPEAKGVLRVKRPGAQQLAGWKGTVIALALAAALAVGYVVGQTSAPAQSPVAVALLAAPNDVPAAMLEVYGNDKVRFLPLTHIDVPAGNVLQFWTWRQDMPIPLGMLSVAVDATWQGPEVRSFTESQVFDVTLEPASGSASGRPTGPSILSGEAVIPQR